MNYLEIARQLKASMPGKMSVDGMAWLAELVGMAPPGLLVDLGTYWGRSAMLMALASDKDRRILSIDNYCEGPDAKSGGGPYPNVWDVQKRFKRFCDRVHFRVDKTYGIWPDENTRTLVDKIIGDLPIALVFVDGDHTGRGVHYDIEAWEHYVTEGGVMAFDDYGSERWPGVKNTVGVCMEKWQPLGVRGTVAAFRRG